MGGNSPSGTEHPILLSLCGSNETILSLQQNQSPSTVDVFPETRWVYVREAGQELKINASPESEIFHIAQPFRFGSYWIRVDGQAHISVQLRYSTSRPGLAMVELHCANSEPTDREQSWLRRLSEINAQIDSPVDRNSALLAAEAIKMLKNSAATGTDLALATHLHAFAVSSANEPDAAAAIYMEAQAAWEAVGDSDRALAAKMGRIQSENSARQLNRVLDDTEYIASTNQPPQYFVARMLNERCLALEDLGNYEQATPCYDRLLAQLKLLDERGEYAIALKNYASLLHRKGNLDESRNYAEQAIALAQGTAAPMARGRGHYLLSVIDREMGLIPEAISEVVAADREFADAGAGALQSRGFSLINQALLMEQIGADGDALDALSASFALLPAYQFVALRAYVFALLEIHAEHIDSAQMWLGIAESAFEQGGQIAEREAARLLRLKLLVSSDHAKAALQNIDAQPAKLAQFRPQETLLRIEIALAQQDSSTASQLIELAQALPLTLPERLRLVTANANLQAHMLGERAAQKTLTDAAEALVILATNSGNLALQHILASGIESLRRSSMEHAVCRGGVSLESEQIALSWRWLNLIATAHSHRKSAELTKSDTRQLDRSLATELLPTTIGAHPAPTSMPLLLANLAPSKPGLNPSAIATKNNFVSLDTFRQALPPDSIFIAYIEGQSCGRLLTIGPDSARLVATDSPGEIRDSVHATLQLLQSRTSRVADIDDDTGRLSHQLLDQFGTTTVPRRLLIDVFADATDIPWSILIWPGTGRPMIDTTTVDRVSLTDAAPDSQDASSSQPALSVIVASQPSAALPTLAAATIEPGLIESAIGRSAVTIADPGTRANALDALDIPHGWVHFAAHGRSELGHLGRSGLWLATEDSGASNADFLSWFDVLQHRIRSDLVVFDACQLAARGDDGTTNLSFSQAAIVGGAQQVVAAQWPVSDTASALWVPAFYAAISTDPTHDAASALQAAQQRLRRSRAFSHPFYWSGLQSMRRMAVNSKGE